MDIGSRIKRLRKSEMLTQQEFTDRLGIKRAYLSQLEAGKKTPSEQLILGICRAFRVRIEWLKEGNGEMYDTTPLFSEKGHAVLEEIANRLASKEKQVSVGVIAELLGIDVDNFPAEREKFIKVDNSILFTLKALIAIYREGDKNKIEAIMAQLKVLKPEKDSDDEGRVEKKGA